MRFNTTGVLAAAALAAGIASVAGGQPARRADEGRANFSFAVLADVQYADKDTAGVRSYRRSLARLEEAAAGINTGRPAFVVNLGDLIDAAPVDNLTRGLDALRLIQAPIHHVLGNHDFSLPRRDLLHDLGMPRAYYDFSHGGWRFVVLDGMDVSVAGWPPEHAHYREGKEWLDRLRAQGSRNAADWNGGIGEEQMVWLRGVLQAASHRRERVIVLCHFPVVDAASTPAHLLWNHAEVLHLIEDYDVVVAWFNGHDHRGGYEHRAGIHHVTFPGMVESGDKNSWTSVSVFRDRLQLRGAGTAPSRVLELRR